MPKSRYRKALISFKKCNFNERNKKIVLEFLKTKESQNLSVNRLLRILASLKLFCSLTEKEFDKLSQKDFEELILKILNKNYKEWTKVTNLKILKMFGRWLNENYGLNLNVDVVKTRRPKNSLLPEYLITEEEFNKLINVTDDLQTRLLIGLLYESGARVGEILSLKIQNVSFNQYGAKMIVKGKTGQRVIPIIWFANLLRQFIESHPFKDNPEAYLFFYKNREGKLVPMRYSILRMRLKSLCEKAGIKKRIHPHLFRHTRLTELAKHLPEQILKQIAGWVPDSDMAQTYLHLSQKDVEESLLAKVYGIKVNGEEEKDKFKVCPKCGELNPYFAKVCQRCKTPLDEKRLMELVLTDEQIKEINDWAEVLLAFLKVIENKYPDIWKEMLKILKEKGKEHLLRD